MEDSLHIRNALSRALQMKNAEAEEGDFGSLGTSEPHAPEPGGYGAY